MAMEKILVYQHVIHEHAGRFGEIANKAKIKYDVVELWKDYRVPDFKKYTRLLIMGGPQSAYDPLSIYRSKDFEISSIRKFTEMNKPVLGFCLGSQLIAHSFGCKVYQDRVNGKPFKETGFFKIGLTDEGKSDRLFKGFPRSFEVFQWHGDVFDLPDNAALLASGHNVVNQVFKLRNSNAYGCLFHFDFTSKMVEQLIRIDNEWLHKGNNVDEKAIIKLARKYDKHLNELAKRLFQNWMSLQ